MLLVGWNLPTSLHDPVILIHLTSIINDLLRFSENYGEGAGLAHSQFLG